MYEALNYWCCLRQKMATKVAAFIRVWYGSKLIGKIVIEGKKKSGSLCLLVFQL